MSTAQELCKILKKSEMFASPQREPDIFEDASADSLVLYYYTTPLALHSLTFAAVSYAHCSDTRIK